MSRPSIAGVRATLASTVRAREIAGAFGDIGVFLPLSLGLVAVNGLNPTLVFGLAGLYYLATGWFYRLPVPVQPFKAVSAIAIAQSLSAGTIQAAALGMSAGLLLLSIGRIPDLIGRLFAPPVVRGIQLGLGLILLTGGLQLVVRDPRLAALADMLPGLGGPVTAWLPLATLAIGVVGVALLQRQARVPVLFIVGAIGLVVSVLTVPADLPPLALGPVLAPPTWPTGQEFAVALVVLVLPQLPLTLGNSVVSTTDVAREYFGPAADRVRPTTLLRDMGLANLASGLGGGIPMCHGAGGMTAHFRFGARTGLAVAVAGAFYLVIGLGLGAAAPTFLALFPAAILGILVGYVGWQHLLLVRRLSTAPDYAVAFLIGAITLVSGSLALGFGVGLGVYWTRRLAIERATRARTEPSSP